jgi:hypothetical protein
MGFYGEKIWGIHANHERKNSTADMAKPI